jgi:DNA N-6-adenine-methyltransferase (Dam)
MMFVEKSLRILNAAHIVSPHAKVAAGNRRTVVTKALARRSASSPSPLRGLAKMKSEALAKYVQTGMLTAFKTLAPFVEELWKRFDALKPNERIAGCASKKEYCEKILQRTPRATRYMLGGGNNKRSAGETVSLPREQQARPDLSGPGTERKRFEKWIPREQKALPATKITSRLPNGFKWTSNDNYETPKFLYDALDREFGITLDPCPLNPAPSVDGIDLDWTGETVFCNPPWSNITPWVKKALDSNCLTVFVLPARTDTEWYHTLARRRAELRLFRKRVNFIRDGGSVSPTDGTLVAIVNRAHTSAK